MTGEIVKQTILEELSSMAKNNIFLKTLLKRCNEIVFDIDYDKKKVHFDLKRSNGKSIFKKSYNASDKLQEDKTGNDIYIFDKNDINQALEVIQ